MNLKIKQISFSNFGDPEVLQLIESELPAAAPGELLLQISAIGVNYSDILRRRNRYFMPTPLPFVLGSEAVGTVLAVGEGVGAPYLPGTRVLAILPRAGAYATHVLAPAAYCVPLPPAIDDLSATAIFVQGTTAQLMINHHAGDLQGKMVLIQAAAGGVGSLLVQLAKAAGATVIAACSSSHKEAIAKAQGADFTVNYTQADWSDRLKKLTNGHGVQLAFEMVGGEPYTQTIKSLAPGGKIIVYGCASGVQGQIHPEYFVDQALTQEGFNLAHYIEHKTPLWQAALGEIIGKLAQGSLRVQTPKTFALHQASEAHTQLEARETTGKVVLIP